MTTLLTDELWAATEPLLPRHQPSPKGGRPFCDDRPCLEAILYVLQGGIAWRLLPKEFGVSPCTAWRRFRDWTRAGVWDKVHRKLLKQLALKGRLRTETVVVDSASVRAVKGGSTLDPTPQTAEKPAANAI